VAPFCLDFSTSEDHCGVDSFGVVGHTNISPGLEIIDEISKGRRL
jgi:hypothetical protein